MQEKINEISEFSQKNLNSQMARMQEKLDRQVKLNRDLRKNNTSGSNPPKKQFQSNMKLKHGARNPNKIEKKTLDPSLKIDELDDEDLEDEESQKSRISNNGSNWKNNNMDD